MADGIIGSVGVSVVPDANDFWRRFEAQTRAGASESGRRAGNDWSRGFRAGAGEPTVNVRVNTKQAQKEATSLLGVLGTLAPALVPLAGAAALGGAALADLGVAGVLAFKGIQADIKAANADGVKFAAGLAVLKNDLHGLEQTAAHNVLGEFQQVTAKLHAQLPALNNDMAQSSQVLGSIAGHLLGGVIGGLHNFSPALLAIEHGVDGVAAKFESWATGAGGAKFASTLIEDFQHVEPLLENLSTVIGHLVAASNGPGLAIVDELNVFAKILASIPVPVLSALTTGIVSLRIASTVSGLMGKLASSIRDVEDAENGAGGAAGGFRGRLGATVDAVGKLTAGWVAASVAVGALDQATKSWANSTSDLQYGTHYIVNTFDDLLKFNFKGFWGDITGTGAAKAAAEMRGHIGAIDAAVKLLSVDASKATSELLTVHGNTYGYQASSQVTGNFDPNVVARSNFLRVASQEAKTYQATIRGLMATLSQFYREAASAPLSQVQQAYSQQASSIDKADTSLQKFLTSGAKSSYTYQGITVGVNAWDAALKKSNGDVAAAEGIINGQIDALVKQRSIYGDLTQGSLRLGEATGAAGAKYKLSTDQVDTYAAALGISAAAVARGTITEREFIAAIGKVAHAFSNSSTSVNQWVAAVAAFNKAGDTAASRALLIGEALRAANGDALGYANTMVQAATANQQLVTDFKNLKKGVLDLKTGTLDYHNAAAAPLLGDLQNLQTAAMNAAAATYQHEQATGKASAADDAFRVYVNDTRGALIKQADQLGITKGEAKKLADEYFGIKHSGDLKKQIALIGQDKVLTALQGILHDLDLLAGVHRVDTYVYTHYEDIHGSKIGSGSKGRDPRLKASGTGSGVLPNGWAWVGDPGPHAELTHTTPQGTQVISAPQSKKIAANMGWKIPGYAGGTNPGGESGGFSGVDYSGTANKYGTPKAKKGAGGTYTVAGQKYSSLQAAENAAARLFKADVTLGVKIDDKDLTGFRAALNGTVAQASAAFNTLYSDANKLGISDKLAATLRKQNIKLDAAIEDRNKAKDRLKTVTDQFVQVRDAVSQAGQGAFDITTSGTGYDGQQPVTFDNIQAQETQSKNRVVKWAAGLRALAKTFGKTSTGRAMLRDLAEKGPDDLPEVQALLSASPKDLAGLVDTQYQIDKTSADLGTFVGNQLYGKQISGLQREISIDQKTVNAIGAAMGREVEHAVKQYADRPIDIYFDSKRVARVTAKGTKKASR